MTFYGPGLGTLWRTIEAYGHDPRTVISEAQYTPGATGAARVRLSYAALASIRSRAIELADDPLVGLRSAEYLHPSHLGPLGYAWLASATLLDGFRRLMRYGRMFNEREALRLEEDSERVTVTLTVPSGTEHADEVRDALMAGLVALCRANYGPELNPDRVRLTRRPPAEPGPWFSFFRCPVDFSCEADQVVLSLAKAQKLLSGSDPQIAAMHDEAVERYLGGLDRTDVVARTKIQILDLLPAGGVSEASVASALAMSPRTLHRKLRDRGHSFRSLLVEVRKELVRRYMGDQSMTLTDIAFMLGYTDASAFSRAFTRWFGRPPRQMRHQWKGVGAPEPRR